MKKRITPVAPERERQIALCPFCGGEGIMHTIYSSRNRGFIIMVKCSRCGSQGQTYFTHEDPEECDWRGKTFDYAVEAWNRRYFDEDDSF